MRCDDALRQLLTCLVAADEDTEAGRRAMDRADDVLAAFIVDREAAGRTMLAMASVAMYAAVDGGAVEETVTILTSSGDPIDHFEELLEATAAAIRTGGHINERAIRLSGQISRSREDTSLVLWVLGVYLAAACNRADDEPEHFIGEFIAACLRQDLIPSRPLKTE